MLPMARFSNQKWIFMFIHMVSVDVEVNLILVLT